MLTLFSFCLFEESVSLFSPFLTAGRFQPTMTSAIIYIHTCGSLIASAINSFICSIFSSIFFDSFHNFTYCFRYFSFLILFASFSSIR